MVIFLEGNSSNELAIALLTRSFASSIDLLPIPTICIVGSPFFASLSTSMIAPSNPIGATVIIFATIF